ncbi:calcium-binding protein [Methylobacterium aquaticum]|uniref:calcium-binding protein n=1 Tax=Methylobacterium aquaticum TaxID=270351 RepID=UPI003D182393
MVISSVNFALTDNIEGLFLTGSANYGKGNEGDNILYGTHGDDYLYGEGGHDLIIGDLGSDRLYGGSGDDSIYGGRGNDLIDGGSGNDTAIMNFDFTESYVESMGYVSVFNGPHGIVNVKNVETIEFTGRNINQNDGNIIIDDVFYFARYHDVYRSSFDADDHFNSGGWREGRNPNNFFDTSGYLSAYADVAASGMNPLDHYLLYGWSEGRDPSANFDTRGYLSTHTDVAAAGMNPLSHFLQYGSAEGRSVVSGDGRFAVAIGPGVYG